MLATMWTIALHEAQDQLASRRMGLAGLFCALLTVASLSLLLGDYTVRKHGYDQRDQAGQTRAGKRPKLSAPPTPLSVLARGLEMHNGRLLFITWSQPRRQPGAAVMDQGDPNPLFEIFQAPDLVHIVQYVLSLLALLAAYDAICGERLRGTLALVFTGPLRRGVFIAGKALGVLLGLLAIFLPICVVVVGRLALMPGLGLAGEDWLRIGGVMVCSLLFMAIFVHMGLWASALFARPSSALLLLLALWVGWVSVGATFRFLSGAGSWPIRRSPRSKRKSRHCGRAILRNISIMRTPVRPSMTATSLRSTAKSPSLKRSRGSRP